MKEGMPTQGPAPELRPFAEFAQGEKLADEQRALNATIEAGRLAPEVQSLNDKAELEIYGSGNHTYVDPEGAIDPATGNVKIVASPDNPMTGKLDEIMSNPRYGKGTIEREKVKKAYLGDLEKLTDGESGLEISQAKLVLDLREERQEADSRLSHKLVGNYIHKVGTKEEAVQKAEKEVAERQLLTGNSDDFVQRVIREKGIYTREALDAFKQTPEYGEMVKANVTSERVKEAAAARVEAASNHVAHEQRRAEGKNPKEPEAAAKPTPDAKTKPKAPTGPTTVGMELNPDTKQFVYTDKNADLAHIAANIVFNPDTNEFVYTDDAGKKRVVSDTQAKHIFETLSSVSNEGKVLKEVNEVPEGPEPTPSPAPAAETEAEIVNRRAKLGKAASKLFKRSRNKAAKTPKVKEGAGSLDELFPPLTGDTREHRLFADKDHELEEITGETTNTPEPTVDAEAPAPEPETKVDGHAGTAAHGAKPAGRLGRLRGKMKKHPHHSIWEGEGEPPSKEEVTRATLAAEGMVGTKFPFEEADSEIIGFDGTKVTVRTQRADGSTFNSSVDLLKHSNVGDEIGEHISANHAAERMVGTKFSFGEVNTEVTGVDGTKVTVTAQRADGNPFNFSIDLLENPNIGDAIDKRTSGIPRY